MRLRAPSRRPALPGRLAAVAFVLLAGGCSGLSRNLAGAEAGRGEGWTRVEDVPELRQTGQHDCGAAALAMVLRHHGKAVTPAEIWAASPPPPGRGLRADALRAYARGQGLQAFLIEGRPDDLEREVSRGRPVLVGVVKGRGERTYPHYEVVVGIQRRRGRILTLDPARGAQERSARDFAKEWAAAGRLALVVLPAPSPSASAAASASR